MLESGRPDQVTSPRRARSSAEPAHDALCDCRWLCASRPGCGSSPAFAQVTTPPRGSPLRAAILDGLRPMVEAEVGKPVEFVVHQTARPRRMGVRPRHATAARAAGRSLMSIPATRPRSTRAPSTIEVVGAAARNAGRLAGLRIQSRRHRRAMGRLGQVLSGAAGGLSRELINRFLPGRAADRADRSAARRPRERKNCPPS